jgi:hypothetical protein
VCIGTVPPLRAVAHTRTRTHAQASTAVRTELSTRRSSCSCARALPLPPPPPPGQAPSPPAAAAPPRAPPAPAAAPPRARAAAPPARAAPTPAPAAPPPSNRRPPPRRERLIAAQRHGIEAPWVADSGHSDSIATHIMRRTATNTRGRGREGGEEARLPNHHAGRLLHEGDGQAQQLLACRERPALGTDAAPRPGRVHAAAAPAPAPPPISEPTCTGIEAPWRAGGGHGDPISSRHHAHQ